MSIVKIPFHYLLSKNLIEGTSNDYNFVIFIIDDGLNTIHPYSKKGIATSSVNFSLTCLNTAQ